MIDKHPIHHLALIMDGNRRWARKNKKSISDGYRSGIKTMARVVPYLFDLGISVVSVYAFSLDNWNREREEIDNLHSLVREYHMREIGNYKKEKIRVYVSGTRDFLSRDMIESLEKIQEETREFSERILNICFNYSGRREIVEAAKHFTRDVLSGKKHIDEISVDLFKEYLFIPQIPDVDLMIRTSGECRISDFLIYQSAYTEYYFTDILWPDLTKEILDQAIESFSTRDRRRGGNRG